MAGRVQTTSCRESGDYQWRCPDGGVAGPGGWRGDVRGGHECIDVDSMRGHGSMSDPIRPQAPSLTCPCLASGLAHHDTMADRWRNR